MNFHRKNNSSKKIVGMLLVAKDVMCFRENYVGVQWTREHESDKCTAVREIYAIGKHEMESITDTHPSIIRGIIYWII